MIPTKYIVIGVAVLAILFGIYQFRVAIQGWVNDYITTVSESATKEAMLKVSTESNKDLIDRVNAITKAMNENQKKMDELQKGYNESRAAVSRMQTALRNLDLKGLANANPTDLGNRLTIDTNGTIGLLNKEGSLERILLPGSDGKTPNPAPAAPGKSQPVGNAGQVGRPYARRHRGHDTSHRSRLGTVRIGVLRKEPVEGLRASCHFRGAIQSPRE